jgi:hypothetical protein
MMNIPVYMYIHVHVGGTYIYFTGAILTLNTNPPHMHVPSIQHTDLTYDDLMQGSNPYLKTVGASSP